MAGMSDSEVRLIVTVPNLNVTRVWDVGHVYFHPAGAGAELIEEARDGTPGRGPPRYQELVTARGRELDPRAVAEVTVAGIDEAISLVARALAILRIVQCMQHPMVDVGQQTFGLPGEVMSASIDYLSLTRGPAWGWRRLGAATGCRLHAVLCELMPGGFSKEISAA